MAYSSGAVFYGKTEAVG